jgi:hypothetical protein
VVKAYHELSGRGRDLSFDISLGLPHGSPDSLISKHETHAYRRVQAGR